MPRRTSFAILMLLGFLFCLGSSARAQATSTAVFVRTDTTTQGNWKNIYGSEGYYVINDSVSYPSYAQITPSGHSSWSWASTTSDVRALQKAASTTDRIAACWYTSTSFTIDLNLTDGKTHRVALYCLDWDNYQRAQTIEILDASNGSLLNSQSVSSFASGKYLVWNIGGNVRIRVTNTGPGNAVVSGLFFSNNPMTVSITAPLNQAIFTAPASITIDANASHGDGSVSKVEFFQASTKLGEDTTSPYSFAWSNVSAGSYALTAKATDNTGATATSTQVNISVSAGGISYFYDELGRLVGVTDPASDTAVYSYDAVGNLLSIARRSSALVSIIEFTPNGGPVGTSVTIYGTGFSTTPSQNTVTFNGVSATVTSATATQIMTSVPAGATTGPIVVTSPAGSATSSTSFTVGASAGAPAITSFTPTIGTIGSAVTINGANFETVAGNNRVKFNTVDTAVSSAINTSITTTVPQTGSGRITVATPNGTAVSSGDFFVPTFGYTASDVEFTGRMSIGSTSTVTINTANKIGLMVFDGTAGQRISLNMTGVTMPSYGIAIYNPDGTTLYSAVTYGSGGGFLDTNIMLATGTYTILIDPSSTYTGSVTLALWDVSDVTGTIIPGGSPVTVTTSIPGQNGRLTFSGTAGQRISLNVGTTTYNGTVYIYKPNWETLDAKYFLGANGAFFDTLTLPTTGTYSIVVDPDYTSTGSVTLTLYNVVDFTGTVTVGGAAQGVTISTPGQNGRLTFSGTAGQQVTVRMTGNNMNNVTVKLLKPDGSVQTSIISGSSSFDLATQTLATTGTYTIIIDPAGTLTGSISVNVTSP